MVVNSPAGVLTFVLWWFVWLPSFTAIYVAIEGFEPWQSFIFVHSTITTIGFGNTVPITPLGRIMTVVCGLVGIPLVFGAIAYIGHILLQTIEPLLKLFSKAFLNGQKVTQKMRVIVCIALTLVIYFHAVAVYCLAEDWSVADAMYYVFRFAQHAELPSRSSSQTSCLMLLCALACAARTLPWALVTWSRFPRSHCWSTSTKR